MGTFGATEIIILLVILVLFFGAKKIPELARGIGEGMTEFKKATNQELDDNKNNEKKRHSDSNDTEKKHVE